MRIKELAEECRKATSCDDCSYTEHCKILRDVLEDMSPMGVVEMVEENLTIE